MPEVTHRRAVAASPEAIWDFVKDINKWAPMMTGYVKHEVQSETRSNWTLKGDVGILSREVVLQVDITEWSGPEKVAFTLTGIGEAVSGNGAFEILPNAPSGQPMAQADVPEPPREEGLWARFVGWLVRLLLRKTLPAPRASPAPGFGPDEARPGSAELVFSWSIEAGGATAPLVNAMLAPAMAPAAEHLAGEIAAAVEG